MPPGREPLGLAALTAVGAGIGMRPSGHGQVVAEPMRTLTAVQAADTRQDLAAASARIGSPWPTSWSPAKPARRSLASGNGPAPVGGGAREAHPDTDSSVRQSQEAVRWSGGCTSSPRRALPRLSTASSQDPAITEVIKASIMSIV